MSTKQHENPAPGEVVDVTREGQLARYEAMILSIPQAEDGDGEGIILDILNAASWEDLNGGSKLPSFKDLAGKTFKVNAVTRRASDEAYGAGWYLIADCTDLQGRDFKAQTSAGAAMATLVKLHQLDVFPAVIEVLEARTNSGQTAINVTVKAASPKPRS